MMYQFIVDLGDIFRERLLYHATEPETLTISLTDPYTIVPNSLLDLLLSHSTRESILYKRMETSAMKPKQTSKIKPREYMISRIYSPILEISYRPRWPRGSEFTASELMSLLNPKTRGKTKRKLQQRQRGKEASALGVTSLLDYNLEVDNDEEIN